MTPDELARSGTEHGHQRALFHWANQAHHYGFTVANMPEGYESKEHAEQLAIIYKNQNMLPDDLDMMFAIPNGGLRDKITANKLKLEGVKAGVLDVFLPKPVLQVAQMPNGVIPGMFIEMKDPKRRNHKHGGLSEAQIVFGNRMAAVGYRCVAAYTWREAADHIERYYGFV